MRRKEFQDILINISSGTAQQNLSPISLSNLSVLIPDRCILDLFAKQYSSIFWKITLTLQENELLKKMENILLSKLATIEK